MHLIKSQFKKWQDIINLLLNEILKNKRCRSNFHADTLTLKFNVNCKLKAPITALSIRVPNQEYDQLLFTKRAFTLYIRPSDNMTIYCIFYMHTNWTSIIHQVPQLAFLQPTYSYESLKCHWIYSFNLFWSMKWWINCFDQWDEE